MMLSVLKHTTHPVKFWFLENYLSPTFKDFIPHMAEHYGFQYQLVQYGWPRWLHQQKEKQRLIWGYKILFLDVLFPLSVKHIIFVDADQVHTDFYIWGWNGMQIENETCIHIYLCTWSANTWHVTILPFLIDLHSLRSAFQKLAVISWLVPLCIFYRFKKQFAEGIWCKGSNGLTKTHIMWLDCEGRSGWVTGSATGWSSLWLHTILQWPSRDGGISVRHIYFTMFVLLMITPATVLSAHFRCFTQAAFSEQLSYIRR